MSCRKEWILVSLSAPRHTRQTKRQTNIARTFTTWVYEGRWWAWLWTLSLKWMEYNKWKNAFVTFKILPFISGDNNLSHTKTANYKWALNKSKDALTCIQVTPPHLATRWPHVCVRRGQPSYLQFILWEGVKGDRMGGRWKWEMTARHQSSH